MKIAIKTIANSQPHYFDHVSFIHQSADDVYIVFDNGDEMVVKTSELLLLLIIQA